MNKTKRISIIIATYNRPKYIKSCIKAILKNSYTQWELIIVDQSENNLTYKAIKQYLLVSENKKIRYFKIKKRGVGYARNAGILYSEGSIIAFTDDDCIPEKNWLKSINSVFKSDPSVLLMFGCVLPYKKTKPSNKHICPSINATKHKIVYDKWNYSSYSFHPGNNMVFRRKLINIVGNYRDWLGNGSVTGGGSEETEIIFRMMYNQLPYIYDPRPVVFHDRWVTLEEYFRMFNVYERSVIAIFIYYLIVKQRLMPLPVLIKNMVYDDIKVIVNPLRKKSFRALLDACTNLLSGLFYGFIGIYYSLWKNLTGNIFVKTHNERIN